MLYSRFTKSIVRIIACSSLFVTFSHAVEDYQAPRNEFGQPDISGTWAHASLTFLERPDGFKTLVVTEEQAEPFVRGFLSNVEELGDPDTFIGGVNSLMRVDGELRSSVIVDPPDGKLPSNEAAGKVAEEFAARRATLDGPEALDLDERCLGSIGYPPLMTFIVEIPTKIVQTADYVMIKTEDPTVARIIRLSEQHSAVGHRTYAGSSTGRWEGETFVVTSSHFRDEELTRLAIASNLVIGPNATITERFTPISESQMHYHYTVHDEDYYDRPWSGEFTMTAIEDAFYEYSCHEGNYSMTGILAGAKREQIQEEMTTAQSSSQ